MTGVCGLIVNPVAGIGGEAALAGSDGEDVQQQALARGARPRSGARAERALRAVVALTPEVHVLTGGGAMGEEACRRAGIPHTVVHRASEHTTADDTRRLAMILRDAGVEVLLFAGGDGTARDVCEAVGTETLVLGIPSGVKMHSGVYAVTPEHAGPLLSGLLAGTTGETLAEVVDIDEEARRRGVLGARLYGYLRVPEAPEAIQRGKVGSTADPSSLGGIAREVAERLAPGVPCLLGPGTTVREVAAQLGVQASLLGVDVLEDGRISGENLDAAGLRRAVGARRFQVLLSPIGGQGVLLGRGNQQIDESLLQHLHREDLLVVSSPRKLASFAGRGLLIDAPTAALNERFRGRVRVITGYRQEALLPLR
ncbi:ATP-NAD kinase family protein [Microbacterium sp.]|uniref:ATP-NAD kinase family protein n=1 Tax=Microbacterium sp. TaxID=51671 RepID=UPI002811C11C|nr:ATP-NAD kinase family protein [Microbacterium sp.]